MKRISILFLLTISLFSVQAQQAIKMTTYNAKFSKNQGGTLVADGLGTPATTIQQKEFGGAVVYFKMDVLNFKAIKAKYRLDIQVMKVMNGVETPDYKIESFIPTKNGFHVLSSEFGEGSYTLYVRDQDHPEDVYSKTNFIVPAKPVPDYKNNSTLVVCNSVDDNWNAVGATAKVAAGTCMNFLYKAKDKVGYTVLIWNVVRVNDDGNEDYVTHLVQGTTGKPFRFLATTEGVCQFTTPGKYRVYLFPQDKYDTGIQRDEKSEYIGKTEITVY